MKALFITGFLAVSFLAGCGGGGGDGDLSKLVCSNFGTQEAAQDAFRRGAKQLDGDNDGVACESLPHEKTPTALTFNFQLAVTNALATGVSFTNLRSASAAGSTLDIAYQPQTDTVFESITQKRALQTVTLRQAGGTSATENASLIYTAAPLKWTRATLASDGTIYRYVSRGTLPTAGMIGASGAFTDATAERSLVQVGTETVTWSLEASDSTSFAWACLNSSFLESGVSTSQKECYRISTTGAISAARVVFTANNQTVTYQ